MTHQTTQCRAAQVDVETLVKRAEAKLATSTYSRRSRRRYHTVWNYLAQYAKKHQNDGIYSDKLAAEFFIAYQPKQHEILNSNNSWRQHLSHCLRVLRHFERTGHIIRPRSDTRSIELSQGMRTILSRFERHCSDELYLSHTSVRVRMHEVTMFVHSLEAERSIASLTQIQPHHLSDFIVTCGHYSRKTVSTMVSSIRCFLKFLLKEGILYKDLSESLPTVRVPARAGVPSVWDPALIKRLLNAVDRSSPRGKRDYAILMLAARLGLRVGDIRALTLGDIHWDTATLEICQAKTRTPLSLPLSEGVGEALIDYLRAGRPETPCREVFVQARPPFLPFSTNARFYEIVTYWKDLAGIHFRTPQRQGLHSLRHSLATQLLQQGTPINVISDVLGHRSVNSTLIYAKTAVEALREAALPVEEACDDQ
jgi:integrase